MRLPLRTNAQSIHHSNASHRNFTGTETSHTCGGAKLERGPISIQSSLVSGARSYLVEPGQRVHAIATARSQDWLA